MTHLKAYDGDLALHFSMMERSDKTVKAIRKLANAVALRTAQSVGWRGGEISEESCKQAISRMFLLLTLGGEPDEGHTYEYLNVKVANNFTFGVYYAQDGVWMDATRKSECGGVDLIWYDLQELDTVELWQELLFSNVMETYYYSGLTHRERTAPPHRI